MAPRLVEGRIATRTAFVASLVVAATGAVVIIGWHARIEGIVQLRPTFAPMQHNTALGMLLAGLGLLALVAGRTRLAVALASATVAIGAVTGAQYAFGVDLGIDTLAVEPFLTVKTSHPGRMAPNTAACFVLTGVGLLVGGSRAPPIATASLAIGVASMGAIALIGYLTGFEAAYGWLQLTRMAAHTSVGFVLLGLGLLAHTYAASPTRAGPSTWSPIAVLATALTLTLTTWLALGVQHSAQLQRRVRQKLEDLASETDTLIHPRIEAVERMAARWRARGGTPREEWMTDANAYVADFPEMALQWIDSAGVVRWTAGHGAMLDERAGDLPGNGDARRGHATTLRPPVELGDAGKALLIEAPLWLDDGRFDGHLVAVLHLDDLLRPIVEARVGAGFAVSFRVGEVTAFAAGEPAAEAKTAGQSTLIDVRGQPWELTVAPEDVLVAEELTAAPAAIVGLLLVLSLTLSGTTLLFQRARLTARDLAALNDRLATEVAARERAQRALEATVEERTADRDAQVAGRIEAEQRAALASEAGHIGVWEWNITEDVIAWDRRMHAIFGTVPADVEPSHERFRACLHPEDTARVDAAIKRSIDDDVDYRVGFRVLVGPDRARTRHVDSRGVVLRDDQGRPTRMLGVCIDVTDHREVERRLRQINEELERRVDERTAELKRSNRDLESFSYSISHDLRAPLRHAKGFAEMLRRRHGEALSEDATRQVEKIVAAIGRMGDMIEALLAFSRTGRAQLHRAPVPTSEMVDAVRSELAAQIGDREIVWSIGELPVVEADPTLLRLVFDNLISNAIKFTGHRAKAQIEIAHRVDESGAHEISIRDDGAGFDQSYASKLFGIFQRLHGRDEFEGTGIGLANVRSIIERHGGRVWAEGRKNEGATFFFTLPGASAVSSGDDA